MSRRFPTTDPRARRLYNLRHIFGSNIMYDFGDYSSNLGSITYETID